MSTQILDVKRFARLQRRWGVGWHTKSSPSVNTRRLLVEHGGFEYDSDAYNDDLPYYVPVAGRAHLVLPYAFDTNDMRFFGTHAFVHAKDFAEYVIDAFDWLLGESRHEPRRSTVQRVLTSGPNSIC